MTATATATATAPARRRPSVLAATAAITRALDVLASHDDIPAVLAAAGITGHRRESDRCPIAEYLKRGFPSTGFEIDEDVIRADIHHSGIIAQIDTPQSIGDFIDAFDEGKFPQLDREATT